MRHKKAFGKDEVFIEKYLQNAAHIEVQILGDQFGNILYICLKEIATIQRRHQKIVERAPAHFLDNRY